MKMEVGKNLPYLRESVRKLTDIYKEKGRILEAYGGNLKAVGLLKIDDIAIADVFIKKGEIFPMHKHDAKEWVIVYSGHIIFNYGDKVKELKAEDSWRIDSGVPHGISQTFEDTRFIAIVIPKDEDFPSTEE